MGANHYGFTNIVGFKIWNCLVDLTFTKLYFINNLVCYEVSWKLTKICKVFGHKICNNRTIKVNK